MLSAISFKKYALLYVLIFLSCVTSCKKESPSFTIAGKLTDLDSQPLELVVVTDIQKQTTQVIDTIEVNKKGEFSSVYFLDPNYYILKNNATKRPLLLSYGQHVTIEGSLSDGQISGSDDTRLYESYETFRKESLDRLVSSVRRAIKNGSDTISAEKQIELRALEVANYELHLDELATFIKDSMGLSIAILPTSIRWNSGHNLPFYEQLVANFSETYPSTSITKQLEQKIEILKKSAIGNTFTIQSPLTSLSGDTISLAPEKATYTLVDLWASWCPPCRTESVLLTKLYKKYSKQGFEIYGISFDKNNERRATAIMQDGRNWIEVSDGLGLQSPIAIEYGIASLPRNYLLNTNGEIVAVNIHNTELEKVIDSLFH